MDQPPGSSFWDAIRSWADSAGLLLPEDESAGGPGRPRVPQSVCDNCPICQGAATLDQVNPDIFTELTDVARSLLNGVGSALAQAAEQRLAGEHGHVAGTSPDDVVPPSPPAADPDDPSI